MPLSPEELLDIEAKNERRRALRADVSKGSWTYDSFAWIEADTRPYKERSCILVRRRSWFDKLLRKHGTGFLDQGTTEGSRKHALQPAHDGLYVEAALNDSIEDDIAKLLSEVRRLRGDLPPPPETPKPRRRLRAKRPTSDRALPAGSRRGDKPIYDTEWEFREWFEDNLDWFGFERVIFSQELCPDYVLKAKSGEELRVEAELFAANFVAHRHDPKKVDRIVACFAAEDEISGVPVLATNDLREYNPTPVRARKMSGVLTPIERRVLSVVMATGGGAISPSAAGIRGRPAHVPACASRHGRGTPWEASHGLPFPGAQARNETVREEIPSRPVGCWLERWSVQGTGPSSVERIGGAETSFDPCCNVRRRTYSSRWLASDRSICNERGVCTVLA